MDKDIVPSDSLPLCQIDIEVVPDWNHESHALVQVQQEECDAPL